MSLFADGVTEPRRFADYRGRSTRSDLVAFWLVTLFAALILGIATIIVEAVAVPDVALNRIVPLVCQWILAIPMLALFVRRLHDQGRSGWWAALCVPVAAQNIIADYYRMTGDMEAMLVVTHSTWHLVAGLPLLAVFMFLLAPGEEGPNRYGSNPRYDQPGEPV